MPYAVGPPLDSAFAVVNDTDLAVGPISAPVAVASNISRNVDNGTYEYKVTYTTDTGKTLPGSASTSIQIVNNVAAGQIYLSNIPISSDSGVSGRNLYRFGKSAYKCLGSILPY
ncbi:MAG: hypothetical protein GKR87_01310 [Kiritimatiellae bacterium]|nr:hypothetical protein [Kiritimatiellia bacterium]